jgi:REP element-mobilizing transposase RayT
MKDVLAYFITFTCYGTWLHGDERGSVDDDHNTYDTPVLPADPGRQMWESAARTEPPYLLDESRRRIVLQAIRELALKKGWLLHALHVRTNHIHLVVTAPGKPERVMNDCKTVASLRLNKQFPGERERTRWTRHGSTRYLWTEERVTETIAYVLNGQGNPLERFPEITEPSPVGQPAE